MGQPKNTTDKVESNEMNGINLEFDKKLASNNISEIVAPKENLEKPAILFHASSKNDLDILEPKSETKRNTTDGPVVFATPDKAFASAFLIPWDDSWIQLSRFGETLVMIVSDHDRFTKTDSGGTLYELPSDSFQNVSPENHHLEWKSIEKVKPLKSTAFPSALDAMIENEVQVYFVSVEEFQKIKSSSDHGLSIIQNMKSENQHISKNIKSLPLSLT